MASRHNQNSQCIIVKCLQYVVLFYGICSVYWPDLEGPLLSYLDDS